MLSPKTKLCAALLLTALAGCGSQAPAPQVVTVAAGCLKPPAPPAWAMQQQSSSVEQLDKLFSISGPISSLSAQP